MSLKDVLFGKAAPDRKPSDNPAAKILQNFTKIWKRSASYSETISAEKAMHHPVTFRCLDKLGMTVQSVNWFVEDDPDATATDRRAITQAMKDKIQAVLNSPNNEMTGANLRYWIGINWAAYGRVGVKVGVDGMGAPNAVYPLQALYLTPQKNKSNLITGYVYGTATADGKGEKTNTDTMPSLYSVDKAVNKYPKIAFGYEMVKPGINVVHAGLKPDRNNTPLNAIGLPSDIVLMLMQRAHDTASGHPNSKYIVSTEKLLTAPQNKDIRDTIEDTTIENEQSGNVLILDGTKVTVDKLDNDLSDIHSKMPLDDMARAIAGGFGIPVALLGFAGADGSKFANNYVESRQSFFEDTIDPGYLVPIEHAMTEIMCPPGCRIRFDRDSVPALQGVRVAKAERLSKVTFLTKNEKREQCGYPTRPDGDVYDNASPAASTTDNPPPIT